MITTFGDNEFKATVEYKGGTRETHMHEVIYCLLYTSDAADE